MIKELAKQKYDELIELERLLCAIPAPSGFEDKRAEFCLDYLKKAGAKNSYIDDAKNVICIIDGKTEDYVLISAHTDTVFPDTEPMKIIEDDEKIYCPGACDDTASLSILLMCAKYIIERDIKLGTSIIISANSCEEGLGNLKGMRQIFKDFDGKIKKMFTLDGDLSYVINKSVGSHRYLVKVETEGGHSYNAFGNRNAIHVLADIIKDIYSINVPKKGGSKTTYNVGTIMGGTSVNTIAQTAQILCEYRSDDVECLDFMEKKFHGIFQNAKSKCSNIIVDLVGERPCMKNVDEQEIKKMTNLALALQEKYAGIKPVTQSGSTDCNIPHSLGVPAVCVGVSSGNGTHTRQEYLVKKSMEYGFAVALELILTLTES